MKKEALVFTMGKKSGARAEARPKSKTKVTSARSKSRAEAGGGGGGGGLGGDATLNAVRAWPSTKKGNMTQEEEEEAADGDGGSDNDGDDGVLDGSAGGSKSVQRRRGPRSPASNYRGVSCYKRTGRWEAHIWDSGRQKHLGSFGSSHDAARAYDKVSLPLNPKP